MNGSPAGFSAAAETFVARRRLSGPGCLSLSYKMKYSENRAVDLDKYKL